LLRSKPPIQLFTKGEIVITAAKKNSKSKSQPTKLRRPATGRKTAKPTNSARAKAVHRRSQQRLTTAAARVPDANGDSKSVSDKPVPINDALLTECNKIRDLVGAADRNDVAARYQIAVHCRKVRNGEGNKKKYGAGAVDTLAKALGWCRATVHNYANVAKTWRDERKFVALAGKNDKFRKPLTWHHFVLLTKLTDAGRRDKLAEEALTHGWTVRELEKNLQPDPAEEDSVATPQPKSSSVLTNAVRHYAMTVRTLKSNGTEFGKHLAKNIKDADPRDVTNAVVDGLKQARQDLNELVTQLDKYIKQAQDHRKSAGRAGKSGG
jgi:hypothetical protein